MKVECKQRPPIDASELEYDRHAGSCQICGKRVHGNLSSDLRADINRVAWHMFAPLAFAEAMITLAAISGVAGIDALAMLLLIAAAAAAVLGFVGLQTLLVGRLLRPDALAVIDDRFFFTAVVPPEEDDRYPKLRRFVVGYLVFAKRAGLASFGVYAAVGLVIALATGTAAVALVCAGLGVLWSFTFRTRLAAIQPIELLDVDANERAWLESVQRSSSRMHRLLASETVIQTVTLLHAIVLGLLSLVLVGYSAINGGHNAAAVVAICIGSLALLRFTDWSQKVRAGEAVAPQLLGRPQTR